MTTYARCSDECEPRRGEGLAATMYIRCCNALCVPCIEGARGTGRCPVRGLLLDRGDLDPIERAIGIETMVTELGGIDAVASYYGKTKGWVSQQRKLLKLTRPLQELVSRGEIPVRTARDIAGLPPGEQQAAWEEEQRRRAEARSFPRRRKKPASGEGKTGGTPRRESDSTPSTQSASVERQDDPYAVPWTDPDRLHALILQKTSLQTRIELTKHLLDSNTRELHQGRGEQ